jgi:hypothetical protein
MKNRSVEKEAVNVDALPYSLKDGKCIFPGRPKPVARAPQPEPLPPQVPNLVRYEDLDLKAIARMNNRRGSPRVVKNAEGTRFVGFDLKVSLKSGKTVTGWMPEADFHKLRQAALTYNWGALRQENG